MLAYNDYSILTTNKCNKITIGEKILIGTGNDKARYQHIDIGCDGNKLVGTTTTQILNAIKGLSTQESIDKDVNEKFNIGLNILSKGGGKISKTKLHKKTSKKRKSKKVSLKKVSLKKVSLKKGVNSKKTSLKRTNINKKSSKKTRKRSTKRTTKRNIKKD